MSTLTFQFLLWLNSQAVRKMVWLCGQARLQTPSARLSVHWLLTRNWCWQWCNHYCHLSSPAVGRLHSHQCNQMSHYTPFPTVHWWRSPVDQMSRWSLKSTLLKASDRHFSELLIKQPYYYWLHTYILLHTWSRIGVLGTRLLLSDSEWMRLQIWLQVLVLLICCNIQQSITVVLFHEQTQSQILWPTKHYCLSGTVS